MDSLTVIIVTLINAAAKVFIEIFRKRTAPMRPEKPKIKKAEKVGYQSELTQALIIVAQEIGADPIALSRLIEFESDWNPNAKNPNSSARGLLQFTDATAKDLGYKDSLDLVSRHPDSIGQLYGPVKAYLSQYAPLDTEHKLYMSVFYPVAMRWDPMREFPDFVQKANPGIRSVQEYIDKVNRRLDPLALTTGAIALLGIGLYSFFLK